MARLEVRHRTSAAARLILLAIAVAGPASGDPFSANAAPAASGEAQPAASAAPGRKLNPTDRTLSLFVEVRADDRRLGETAIKIAPDDTLSVNRAQFADAVAPLLRERIADRLRGLSARDGFIPLAALNDAGFKAQFNSGNMRLQFTPAVEQRPRGTIRLRQTGQPRTVEKPARFSGYVNLRAAMDYISASPAGGSGLAPPRADLEAALRWDNVVLETELTYDGARPGNAWRDEAGGAAFSGFTRRGTRLVHDRPEDAVRVQAGDIDPPIASLQRGPDLLGVSVERSLRKLRPGENIRPTGERSFRIARPSTVRIEMNGIIVRQLRLNPGEYDLKDLPLQAGANDVRLIITDDLGEERTLEFTSYFDNALLGEDIYEWGVAAGFLSRFDSGRLSYDTGQPLVTGFYRRGVTSELTGEAHIQAGREAAMAGAGAYTATPLGHFGVEGGLSYHRQLGPGAAVEIDWNALRQHDGLSGLRISAELRSPAFATPGETNPAEDYWLSLLASYSRSLPFGVHANLSGRYAFSTGRTHADDAYSLTLGLSKSLDYNLGLGASLSYSSDDLQSDLLANDLNRTDGELRASLRLSWRPGANSHVAARYETGSDTASVSASRTAGRGTGSWAASIETVYDTPAEELAVDGGITYSGNRALVSLDHTASLDASVAGLTGSLNDQRTTLRIGTAIAFAGDQFAVGPPVVDGFAIVAPHDSLEDRAVLLGDPDAPLAYGDRLGPPLIADLAAYTPRTVSYDVEDLPIGYDLGSRQFTLRPDYKAGYALTVGSDHSVTAFGTLLDAEGEPVALVTGTATPEESGAPSVAVFTNGAGRFGAQGLGPGRWRIEMATQPVQHFVLQIPDGTNGLHRAGTLKPVAPPEED